MPIRIGEDGAIINGDEVISSNGTVIREDGTIESSSISGSALQPHPPVLRAAPVSPLERQVGSAQSTISPQEQSELTSPRQRSVAHSKTVADLEYDLMVAEGHAKGSVRQGPIVALIITLLLGFVFPLLFIGAAVAGYMIYSDYQQKKNYEAEAQRIRDKISSFKRQG